MAFIAPKAASGLESWFPRPDHRAVLAENVTVDVDALQVDKLMEHGQIRSLNQADADLRMAAMLQNNPTEPVAVLLLQADSAGMLLFLS